MTEVRDPSKVTQWWHVWDAPADMTVDETAIVQEWLRNLNINPDDVHPLMCVMRSPWPDDQRRMYLHYTRYLLNEDGEGYIDDFAQGHIASEAVILPVEKPPAVRDRSRVECCDIPGIHTFTEEYVRRVTCDHCGTSQAG